MYNIKFLVTKWKESVKKWTNITNRKKKFIGINKEDAIEIKLCLYHKYYFLDEDIKGICES